MAITIKTNEIKLKTQNGEYQSPVTFADQSTASHIAEVNAAITEKGEEVLDSIPSDYTELTEEVSDLTEDIGDLKSQTTALQTYVRDMSPVAYGNDEGIPVPIVIIRDAAPLNAEDVFFEVEPVQAGTGDPSPDNVRPITGWTGAEVYRTGKNLFDGMIQQGQINSHGENASSNTRIRCVGYIPVKPNMVYTLSRSVSTDALTVRMYDAKKEFLGVGGSRYFTIIPGKGYSSAQPMIAGYTTCSFTFGDGVAYFRFQDQSNDLTAKYQLELGSTATTYEPYQGDIFDITFPSEAGTVYGGTVDLTKGKLVVDRAMYTITGNEPFAYSGTTKTYYANGIINNIANYSYTDAFVGISDKFLPAPNTTGTADWNMTTENWVGYSTNGLRFRIQNFAEDDVAGVKEFLAGTSVVYPLATPVTYDLTPQEIAMFKGVNNLWANTGDISVQYRQDVYTALNNKINALEALVLENMN